MKVTNNIAEEIASWDIIKTAWLMDKTLHITRPHLKKITPEHIIENKINKMRVKHAVQVLSGTMASVIETFTRSKCEYFYNKNKHKDYKEDKKCFTYPRKTEKSKCVNLTSY